MGYDGEIMSLPSLSILYMHPAYVKESSGRGYN
jgi:hypothetical protein